MNRYGGFALTYDQMMEEVPYEQWVQFIMEILTRNNLSPKLMLDLGCGTATATLMLARAGYEMIGVDNSQEMLMVAKEKAKKESQDILFLCQDMQELDLFGTVGAAVSLCDSLNYILTEEELVGVLKRVNNFLDPGGIFIFDLNTDHKFQMLGDQTYAEDFEDSAYIWHNYYDEADQLNEYYLTVFVEKNGHYERFEEAHFERAYEIDVMKRLIREAGMELLGIYDNYQFSEPNKTTERVVYVVQEVNKCKEK